MHNVQRNGFTLIELLVVLVIVAIFATLAAPAFGDLSAAVKLRSASTDLLMSLIYARSEAIKRGVNVSVVPSGGDYAAGWTVQTGTTTLQTEQPLGGVDPAPGASITYRLDGRLTTTSPVDIRFQNSAYASVALRCVLVELSGQPYVKVDTNGNASDGCN